MLLEAWRSRLFVLEGFDYLQFLAWGFIIKRNFKKDKLNIFGYV